MAFMTDAAARHTYGVMQGRLSPREDGRFQAFPRNNWREEFARARAVGLDYIEWIYDEYGRTANPILTAEGRRELAALQKKYGIGTPAICADWLMDFPLLRCSAEERTRREAELHALIPIASEIGARRIVLPFVDQARMMGSEEQRTVLECLRRALPLAERYNVELDIEADLDPLRFAALLAQIPHPLVKVNWDSGNSSGLGYVAREELEAYGDRLGSVHLKDRYRKPEGGVETRPLGEGSADFDDVFRSLAAVGYQGGVTLQVARDVEHDEENFLRTQLAFVKTRRQPA